MCQVDRASLFIFTLGGLSNDLLSIILKFHNYLLYYSLTYSTICSLFIPFNLYFMFPIFVYFSECFLCIVPFSNFFFSEYSSAEF